MKKAKSVKDMFSPMEFRAITAATAGISAEDEQTDCRVINTTAALRLSMIDAIRFDAADKRFGVKANELIAKIEQLSGPEAVRVIAACRTYWKMRCDGTSLIDYTAFLSELDEHKLYS